MVNRLVSVGDDFTLPAAVKAADVNLPARLQDTALNATFVSKHETVLDAVNDLGVMNDGTTDIVAAVNAAFAAMTGAGVISFPPGTYLIDNAGPIIYGGSGRTIAGSPGRTIFIRRNSGLYGAIRSKTTGATSLTALTSDALVGTSSLTVASSAGVTVGQRLIVRSTALASPGSNTTKGEMVLVASVPDATHITIAGTLRDSYTVAASGAVLNPNLLSDLNLRDIIIESEDRTGSTTPLVNLQNVDGLRVEGVTCRNSAGPGLVIDTCVSWSVKQYQAANLQDDETNGKFGYGINVSNCSEAGEVDGIRVDNVRHGFTTTGAPGGTVAGVPRNINVSNGVATNCPTTAAWDTHAEGSNITFTNVKAVNCAIGFQVRSPDTTVQSSSADNCGIGILTTRDSSNCRILGNTITNTRSYGGVYERGNAVVVRGIGSPTDITIEGNIIDGCDQAPVKITRPDTGATGADPVNVRMLKNYFFDGGKATTGRGAVWIEDQVDISSILMVGNYVVNRTAAGKLKWLAEKSGAGAVDGVFMDNAMTGILQKLTPFSGFSPTTSVARNLHTDAVQAPNVGRGIRKGSNLYYGAHGTLANSIPAADQLVLLPFDIDRPVSLSELSAEVNTAGTAGAVTRLGLYFDDGTGYWPSTLVVDAGTIDGTVLGAQTKTFTAITLMPGRYWVGAANQGAPTTGAQLRCISASGAALMPSSTSSASSLNVGAAQNSVTGALPATFTSTYGVAAIAPRVLMRLT